MSIDLWPAEAHGPRLLAFMTLENVSNNPQRGKYVCRLLSPVGVVTHQAVIPDWPRLERDAPALVHAALSAMGYGGQNGK